MKKLLLINIALLIFYSNILPQKISEMRVVGRGEYLQGELIDKNITDANGELCAGLMIQTDLSGLSYDSNNGIVKINHSPGKDVLFLSPNERVIEVLKNGFKPLRIILSEYDVNLKSGQMWKLEITGDDKGNQIPITIMRSKEDAFIYIDGELRGTEKSQMVTPGKHIIRIERAGYRTITDTIVVSTSAVYFDYKMETIQVKPVTFRSVPKDAKLFIDNVEKGVTDFGDYFYPGKYKVRLIKSGYLDYEKEITVKDDGDNNFTFYLTKNSSLLLLNITPPDAEIILNSKIYKEQKIELQPGKYNLEIIKAGYLPQTDTITLALGDTLRKTYTLSQNISTLKLNVSPKDATVLLNKKDYSQRDSIVIAPGLYQLEIVKEGYYPITETVDLKLGKRINKSITLKPKLGELRITTKPLEAKVVLKKDGKVIKQWQGMNYLRDLPVGIYTLTVKNDGYKSQNLNIEIKVNETTVKNITLVEGADDINVRFTLPENYSLSIDGEKRGTVYSGGKTVPTGKHTISLSNSDEDIVSEVYIDESISNISIKSESNALTYLQSFIIPGLGQVTSGRVTPGIIYFAAFAGTAAWHYLNVKDYNDKKDELQTTIDKFNSATDPEEKYKLGLKIDEMKPGVNTAYDKTQLSMWFPIAVYAINILDVLIGTPTQKRIVLSQSDDITMFPKVAMDVQGRMNLGFTIKF